MLRCAQHDNCTFGWRMRPLIALLRVMYVAKTHRLRCFAALSMTVARLGGEWSNGLSLRDVEILRRTLSVRLKMTACCWPRFLHPLGRQFLPLGIHRFDESNLLGSQPPFDLLLPRVCVQHLGHVAHNVDEVGLLHLPNLA